MPDTKTSDFIHALASVGFDVDQSDKGIVKASRDASIFEIRPSGVISPRSSAEIQKIVSLVNRYNTIHNSNISLTVRSGGTDMTGGPLSDSIILDVSKYMHRMLRFENDQITVQPGMFYRDFERITLHKNLILPSFPASREICTVGGMVANNSGGEKTLTHGKTDRYVESLKIILDDGKEYLIRNLNDEELEKKCQQHDREGEIYKKIKDIVHKNRELIQRSKPNVSKNSAGYAIWDVLKNDTTSILPLIIGSQGTLGIITEATFRLMKPKRYSRLLVLFLYQEHASLLPEITKKVLDHRPESFEFFDERTISLAMRLLPTMLKTMDTKTLFHLFWQFIPELWLFIKKGKPRMIALVEVNANSKAETQAQCETIADSLKTFRISSRITSNQEEQNKYLTIRRESFNLLRRNKKGDRAAAFVDDIIVRPEYLSDFLPKMTAILKKYDLQYALTGHLGDGNFHVIALIDLGNDKIRDTIKNLMDELYTLVFTYHGSMTAEHNDGLIRTPYLEKMYGSEIYAIFKDIKNIFDPKNIFNPNKKVGGSLEENLSHIIKR